MMQNSDDRMTRGVVEHDGADDATDITTTPWQNQFTLRMLDEDDTGYLGPICPLVSQVAAELGKPASTATAFCNRISWLRGRTSPATSSTT